MNVYPFGMGGLRPSRYASATQLKNTKASYQCLGKLCYDFSILNDALVNVDFVHVTFISGNVFLGNTEKTSILGGNMEQILHVSEILGTTTALTREQGQVIYKKICEVIDAGDKVSLDFSDIESILSPFLNVAVGKLYNKYSSDTLNDNLNILGISDEQFNIFEIVISNAKSYYKDSQSFNEAVTNGYH